MVLRSLGAATLVQLMRSEREPEPPTDWLLFGPDDPDVIEAMREDPPLLLAAE